MGFRLLLTVGLLVSIGLTTGCKSMSSWIPKRGASGRIARAHSNKPPLFSHSKSKSKAIDNFVKSKQGKSRSGGLIAKATAPAAALGEKLKTASANLTHELAIKPKVIKADDPVSLTTKPATIGVNVYYTAARLADNKGDVGEALKQYHRALEVAPDHLPTLISLARLYDRQDQFGEAVQLYRQAMTVAPENATTHNDLGLCFARQLRNEEALVELRQAIQLDPARKLYRNNVAAVLVALGRSDEALTELGQVYPSAAAYYNLAYLLNRNGHKIEARQQVAIACQADPSLAVARQMLQQLNAELVHVANVPTPRTAPTAGRAENTSNVFTPVSARRSAAPLRRTPPTDSATPNTSIGIPLTPSLNNGASTRKRKDVPLLRFPVRCAASFSVATTDSAVSLPTPSRIESSEQAALHGPEQPRLLPNADVNEE